MAFNLGDIIVKLKADASNMESGLGKASNAVGSFGDKAKSGLSKVGGMLVTLGKRLVLAGVAFATLVGGMIVKGGISRALNIEDAQAKLKGLGHDTKSVTKIMDSALKAVKGTAFGLDEAATAAASAVAAGVKPGKDLQRILSLTGDTATITGRSFNEAGAIINKVLAGNRLSMEEVNQLQDAGLPILQMLGKEYGKNALQMREMVSDGLVDSKMFAKALEKNIGGAALASGETTRGAWKNMLAAMSRVGAKLADKVIPKVRDAFGTITKWFDDNSDTIVKTAEDIATAIANGFTFIKKKVDQVVEAVKSIKRVFDIFWQAIKPLRDFIANQFKKAWEDLKLAFDDLKKTLDPYMPLIKEFAKWFGIVLLVAIGALIVTIAAFVAVVVVVISFIARLIAWVVKAVAKIASFDKAFKGIRDAAVRAFKAIYNGVREWFKKASDKVAEIIPKIKGFFKNPKQWLYNAGKAILEGLWNGLKDKWEEVKEWVGGLGDKIKNLKGPINKDKIMLLNEGKAIMDGLNMGLIKGFDPVANTLRNVSGAIGGGAITNNMTTNLNGSINIQNRQDADYLLKRLNRNQELAGMGLAVNE